MSKKLFVILLCSMLVGLTIVPDSAEAKAAKLQNKKVTITVGQSRRVRLRHNRKKVSWSVLSGKKYIWLKKKSRTGVTIAGKKKGRADTDCLFFDTGNTKRAAELIKEKIGADMVEIQMKKPYSDELYKESQVDLYKNRRPKLKTRVKNIKQYDVILLGFPNWWATMPMPVFSFLEDYNLKGKTILPFVSHGNGIFGESVSELSKAAPKSYIGQGFEFHYDGGSKLSGNLTKWLKRNKIH